MININIHYRIIKKNLPLTPRQEINTLEHNKTMKHNELQMIINSLSEKKTVFENLVEYDLKKSKSLELEVRNCNIVTINTGQVFIYFNKVTRWYLIMLVFFFINRIYSEYILKTTDTSILYY